MNENEMRQIAEKWRKFATLLAVVASILVFVAGIVTSRDPFSGAFLFLPFLLFCLLAGVGIAAWYGLWEMMTAYLDGIATIIAHLRSSGPPSSAPRVAPSVAAARAVQGAQGREQAVLSYAERMAAKEAQPAGDERAELLQRIKSLELQVAAAQSPVVPAPDAPSPAEPGAPATPAPPPAPPATEPVAVVPPPAEPSVETAPPSSSADRVPDVDRTDFVPEMSSPAEEAVVEEVADMEAPAHEVTPRDDQRDAVPSEEPEAAAFEESDTVSFEDAALPDVSGFTVAPEARPVCRSCGADNPPGFAFCTSCGTPAVA